MSSVSTKGFNNPIANFLNESTLSRRGFFKLSAITGGLILGVGCTTNSDKTADAPKPIYELKEGELSAYVHLSDDGKIRVFAANPEVGQGVKTSLPMIVAEELDANWDDVIIENAPVDSRWFGAQFAGGSLSIPMRWQEMRTVGAMARHMVVNAAAQEWQVPIDELTTANTQVSHQASGRSAPYHQFLTTAANLELPDVDDLKFKSSEQYSLLGKRITGTDNLDIVTGQPVFGIDTVVPNMLFATFTKCPTIGGKAVSANLEEVKALPGVVDAFIEQGNIDVQWFNARGIQVMSGVAVVAESTWQAISASKQLKVEWDTTNANADNWPDIVTQAKSLAQQASGKTLEEQGDVSDAYANASAKLSSFYSTDFVSHAQMEPQNCVVEYRTNPETGDRLEAWAPSQTPGLAVDSLVQLFDLPKEAITVHQIRGGGGFGRRLSNEYVFEAALISKKIGRPIKLQWTREDDMAFDFFRVGAFYSLKASLDESGRLNSWDNHLIALSKDGEEPNSGGGLVTRDFPAKMIDHYRVTQSLIDSKTPTGPWRAPSSNTFAFAEQSFVHELSELAGRDHLEFLIESMGEPKWWKEDDKNALNSERAINTIKQVAQNAGWGETRDGGRHLGLSFYFSHAGHIAEAAEVSVDEDKNVTIHKVWVVADVGQIVNLSGAENQCQGSVIDAISTMANQSINIEGGQIKETNFHQYPLLRTNKRPEIDVQFLSSDYSPTGLGEPAFPPLAAAVCNAIFAATGHRIRQLPISNEGFAI